MNSQWLFPFRKIRPSQSTIHVGGKLINLVLIQGQQWPVFTISKTKRLIERFSLLKVNLVLLTNTLTPRLALYHLK